jgi:hypothetical protein
MYKSKQGTEFYTCGCRTWSLSLPEGKTEIERILRIKRQRETFLRMKLKKCLKGK